MARGLKVNGLNELQSLKARVKRQHALGRIWKTDADFLIDHIDQIEARIVSMEETEGGVFGG